MPRTATTRRAPGTLGSTEQLPSGRWRAYYRIKGRRYTAPCTFTTRDAATDWLAAERADRARGTWADPRAGHVSLCDYAAEWLASRADLAPRTRAHYTSTLAHYIAADLGEGVDLGAVDLADLSPALVRRWFTRVCDAAELATRTRDEAAASSTLAHGHPARAWARSHGLTVKDTGRLPAEILAAWRAASEPQTGEPVGGHDAARPGRVAAATAYRVLRAICNAAIRDGLITANPCTIEGAGQVKSAERTPATVDQVAAIADAMPDDLAAAVHLAAWSGLRFGELFALARKHVDPGARSVKVERALDRNRNFGPPKTASSLRTVYLPAFVGEILAAHMARYTGPEPDALIFTAATGSPVRQAHVHKHFTRATAAIGRPDLRWHDLRHTGATLAYGAGGTVRDVQHRLGHSTVRAAMIYAHAADDGDRRLADRLDQVYGHPVPPPTADPIPHGTDTPEAGDRATEPLSLGTDSPAADQPISHDPTAPETDPTPHQIRRLFALPDHAAATPAGAAPQFHRGQCVRFVGKQKRWLINNTGPDGIELQPMDTKCRYQWLTWAEAAYSLEAAS
jgi:integrase